MNSDAVRLFLDLFSSSRAKREWICSSNDALEIKMGKLLSVFSLSLSHTHTHTFNLLHSVLLSLSQFYSFSLLSFNLLSLVHSTDTVLANGDDKPIRSKSQNEQQRTFHPEYTYPLYGEEESIFGYKNLNIRVSCFSSSKMDVQSLVRNLPMSLHCSFTMPRDLWPHF
jgi:hypothetical protein